MYRPSEQTRAITPAKLAASALALLLAIAVLALTAIPAAAGGCTFVAAIAPGPDDEGSQTLTAEVGELITFWGTFVPNATVDLIFEHDGVPYGDFTPGTADSAGDFLFVHDFMDGQEGTWTVTAAVPETECAGTVEVIVAAAAGTAPTPVASPAPALPDTALARSHVPDGMGGPVVAVLVLVLAGAIVLRFRTWFLARSG
jgi:hypothetical protein